MTDVWLGQREFCGFVTFFDTFRFLTCSLQITTVEKISFINRIWLESLTLPLPMKNSKVTTSLLKNIIWNLVCLQKGKIFIDTLTIDLCHRITSLLPANPKESKHQSVLIVPTQVFGEYIYLVIVNCSCILQLSIEKAADKIKPEPQDLEPARDEVENMDTNPAPEPTIKEVISSSRQKMLCMISEI